MGDALADYPALWLLGLFLINFMGNGTVPLPISVYILWLGQFNMPIPVVVVGTLGTVLGWVFVGSRILQRVLKNRSKESLTQKIPALYQKLFLKWPMWAVFLFNAIPFPWDVMRILAVVSGIRPLALLLPLTLGRVIRYSILVFLGGVMAQYKGFLWMIIGLMIVPVVLRFFKKEPKSEY